ncbi:hypothetical protein [Acinetobacter towneri]|uniref:hypothetical protein n=1 Tax=Acinetobacter towneri TaxID=202956 RepID=UPI002577D26F|nr:hypothetical protein [Acinetobacter towneri]MDM1487673.1 hypothetical protein [Acinetobacter towneri]
MHNVSSRTLKVDDPSSQLNCLFYDFLLSRQLNLYQFLAQLEQTCSSELFSSLIFMDSYSDKSIYQSLINRKIDHLTNKTTAIQESVLDLLKVDAFRKSSKFGIMIKKTGEALLTDKDVQVWFMKCYMQIAALEIAESHGLTLKEGDKKILGQYKKEINKIYFLKLFRIYGFKLPLFTPLICALLVAQIDQMPLSFIETAYYAPDVDIGFMNILNTSGGGIFLLFCALFFYTILFKHDLLDKAFSLRTLYLKVILQTRSLIGITITNLFILHGIFTFSPASLFFEKDSIGYHIASQNYEKAENLLAEKTWHSDQLNYVKAQLLLAQKDSIPADQFKMQFISATDQLVSDYRADRLPEWANNYVVAKVLEERNIDTDLMTFEEARMYFFICHLFLFLSFFIDDYKIRKIREFFESNKDHRKIKNLIY